jgi:hypothetical protein
MSYIGDQTVAAGETLVIELSAYDPDGDRVTFEADGAPEGSEIKPSDEPDRAVFTFSPLISQTTPEGKTYPVMFMAKDNRGGEAREDVLIKVLPSWGAPVFVSQSAFVLNLAETDSIKFIIEIKDDDTAKVSLTLKKGIEGGIFEVLDNKKASFFWKPREYQIQQSSFYSLNVSANDGIHGDVFQEIIILLINADMFGECAGTKPVVFHTETADQNTASDYQIQILARDDESEIKSAILYYSSDDPAIPDSYKKIDMTWQQGDLFTASIPGMAMTAGSGRMIYYFFKVTDNDDMISDYCDHQTRFPKSGTFSFAAYDPKQYGYCLDDDYEPDDSIETARPLNSGLLSGMRACGNNPDFFVIKASEGNFIYAQVLFEKNNGQVSLSLLDDKGIFLSQPDTSLKYKSAKTSLYYLKIESENSINYKLALNVTEKECMPDFHEQDNSIEQAPDTGEMNSTLTLCQNDPDFFRIDLFPSDSLRLKLFSDAVNGDIDMALFDGKSDFPVKISEGTGDVEEIDFDSKYSETYYLKIYGYEGASADYSLSISIKSQNVECEDDLLFPNQSLEQAIVLPEGKYTKLCICPGLDDYFYFGLNGWEKVSLSVSTEKNDQSLLLTMYLPDSMTEFGHSESKEGTALIKKEAEVEGNYLIKVSGASDMSVNYDMDIKITDPQTCMDDRLEPNDSVKSASKIQAGFTTHLTLCGSDIDYFRIDMEDWEALSVYGFCPESSSNIHMDLIKINGQTGNEEIAAEGVYDPEIGEFLFFLAHEKLDYYLKIFNPSGDKSVYDIGIYIE